ncbi:hypothetical protein JW960_19990 [candidate division KSB1 bacterium]|nr:hypothetical protein [candidate division KSB1 bacterium]
MKKLTVFGSILICILLIYSTSFAAKPSGILGYYRCNGTMYRGTGPVLLLDKKLSLRNRIYFDHIVQTDSGFVIQMKQAKSKYVDRSAILFPYNQVSGVIDSTDKLVYGIIPKKSDIIQPALRLQLERIDAASTSIVDLTIKPNRVFESQLPPGTYRFRHIFADKKDRPLPLTKEIQDYRFNIAPQQMTGIGEILFSGDITGDWFAGHKTFTSRDTIVTSNSDVRNLMNSYIIRQIGFLGLGPFLAFLGPYVRFYNESAYGFIADDKIIAGSFVLAMIIYDRVKIGAFHYAQDQLRLRYQGSHYIDNSTISPKLVLKTGINFSIVEDDDIAYVPGATAGVQRIWQSDGLIGTSMEASVSHRRFIARNQLSYFNNYYSPMDDRNIVVEDVHFDVYYIDFGFAPMFQHSLSSDSKLRLIIGCSLSLPLYDHTVINEKSWTKLDENQPAKNYDYYYIYDEPPSVGSSFNYDFALQYQFKRFILETHFKKADHEIRLLDTRAYDKKLHNLSFLFGYAF